MQSSFRVRKAGPEDLEAFGSLLVSVYSQLDGFPPPHEQPDYYRLLADLGLLAAKPGVTILIATSQAGVLLGGVVYFDDMRHYGSGGSAVGERDAAGIRLLGVHAAARGRGIGKALTRACIERARAGGRTGVILHTTDAMQVAWCMYAGLGFGRADELDFLQGRLPVYGFRLALSPR